jgi:hypothetical protein
MQKKRTKFQIRSDAAKQRWVRDDKKESFWRKHLQAWKESGLSKRGYCISHNLSQSSFNAWRRELEIRDRERAPSANAIALLSESTPPPAPRNLFVPLQVLPEITEDEQAILPNETTEQCSLELCLPGGCSIRVSHESDLSLIARLLSSLEASRC